MGYGARGFLLFKCAMGGWHCLARRLYNEEMPGVMLNVQWVAGTA